MLPQRPCGLSSRGAGARRLGTVHELAKSRRFCSGCRCRRLVGRRERTAVLVLVPVLVLVLVLGQVLVLVLALVVPVLVLVLVLVLVAAMAMVVGVLVTVVQHRRDPCQRRRGRGKRQQ